MPRARKNNSSTWLKQLKNPRATYRGAPFWAWNARLEKSELVRQVGEFARAGLGGFFMHVRYGLETEYLSAEFLDCVKAVVAAAKKRKMEAWLYDEDRWPCGFAGGAVNFSAGTASHCRALMRCSALAVTMPPPKPEGQRSSS